MAKAVPVVPIELDRPRRLQVTFNALRRYAQTSGKDFNGFDFEGLGPVQIIDELCLAVWAFLVREDEDLTVEQIGDYIGPANIDYVQQQLDAAIGLGLPEPKETDGVPLATANRSS